MEGQDVAAIGKAQRCGDRDRRSCLHACGRQVGALCGLLLGAFGVLADEPLRYGRPERLAEIGHTEVTESSGIALSPRVADLFWTHNDSGDVARLFAFNVKGQALGQCRLTGVTAVDCEDMAAFEWQGRSWLVLGDVGDNARRRPTCQLYFCHEPSPETRETTCRQLVFRYEDGPRDCEGLGVDAGNGWILLATKNWGLESSIYQLELATMQSREVQVARRIATIEVPVATALDISPDGLRAVVGTYSDGFVFRRDRGESWAQAFSRAPARVAFPLRRQGEAVCFGRDGQTLYLTSEHAPSPLWMIPPLTSP